MPTLEDLDNPRYEQLADHFRELIRSKSLGPGDALPTFSMLRRNLRISQGTYERAQAILESEGLVSRKARRGSFVAHLKTSRSIDSIVVTGFGNVGTMATGYWGEMFEGMRVAARADRKALMVLDEIDENIDWSGISGLITLGDTQLQIPVPCVTLLQQVSWCTSIGADESAGIRAAMEHLIELGHRRIAYLHNPWGPNIDERVQAYRYSLMDIGVAPDPRWKRHLTFTTKSGFHNRGVQSMQQWLAEDWKELGCTALLAHNDDTALGVIEALRSAGCSVPGDVSVVGFDGILSDNDRETGLTTVVMPLFEIGRSAVCQLRAAADLSSTVLSIKLQAPLREGNSTAPPR